MPIGLLQDAPDDIEAVGAAVESEFRLGAAFRRQTCHAFRIDIRRVGDDQIIAFAGNRRVQVAAMQRQAILKTKIRNIARGDGERVLGDIDRIDMRVRKGAAGENGQAAGTRTKLQHVFHRAGIVDQRRSFAVSSAEMLFEQFADKGAWHDHAIVDIERQAAHVDLVDEVGGRLARADAAGNDVKDRARFARGHARGREAFELIGMKMQRFAHQKGGFRHRIGGAVRESQFRLVEAACRIANKVKQRQQFAGRDLGKFRCGLRTFAFDRSFGAFGHQDLVQRAAAASSWSRASTQSLPSAPSTRFQNGAFAFR